MEIFGGFMGKQKPTIQDVADMADVSIATVSRIINNKGNIKPSTLEKVELAERIKLYPEDIIDALRSAEQDHHGMRAQSG